MFMINVTDMFKLDGKVAVVTGGARTLGFNMAFALAQAGADLAITSRHRQDCEEAAEKIREMTGKRVLPLTLDVRKEEEVENMVDAVLKEYNKIDILVNNAGNVTSTPKNAPFEVRPLEEWQMTIDVNLTGAFLCAKHVVYKAMKPAKSGNIINLGSVAGITGKDRRVYEGTDIGGSTLDYHAAKAGIINMTRDMAVYLAPSGIRVNCLSPGVFFRNQDQKFVDSYSEHIPMGRFGIEEKELGGAVVYLASEASSYVTGHNLVVDGGMTVW
jgi:NAD(P)-dependent dehydrogenase (short-subunit alcohol dehydrogenase family)